MSVSTDSIGASIINSLGNGSGINIDELATNLTNAETAATKAALESSVEKTEMKISGYSYIKAQLSVLRDSFDQLNDSSDVGSVSMSADGTGISFDQTGAVLTGQHSITVNSLAAAQRTIAGGFSSRVAELNGGSSITLTVTLDSDSSINTIEVDSTTPVGVVSAINDAGLGITASLIDTGDAANPYYIALVGETGSSNSFSITSDSADLTFAGSGETGFVAAQDASLDVNGLTITSDSNEITDVIAGVTMTLTGATGVAQNVTINSDPSTVKAKLENLVAIYNDTVDLLNELNSSESTAFDYSGSLSNDSIVRTILNQIRSAITAESSTPGTNYGFFADIGLEFNEFGDMTFNETKFDEVASGSFEDIVTLLSADTDNQSIYSGQPMGLAFDVMSVIDSIIDTTDGVLTTRTQSSTETLEDYTTQLEDLASRMEMIKTRYIEQFAAMEAAVNSINSTKDYLTQQFEMLANMGKD